MLKAQDKLNQRYWNSQYWSILEEKYKKFLQDSGKENSFDSGEVFVVQNVSPNEYKLYEIKDRRSLIIKLTKCHPPAFYD